MSRRRDSEMDDAVLDSSSLSNASMSMVRGLEGYKAEGAERQRRREGEGEEREREGLETESRETACGWRGGWREGGEGRRRQVYTMPSVCPVFVKGGGEESTEGKGSTKISALYELEKSAKKCITHVLVIPFIYGPLTRPATTD
jgi:hypothetical protein